MSAKLTLDFKGIEDVFKKLESCGDSKKAVEDALRKTQNYITQNADGAIKPHNQTRATEKSLVKDEKVIWNGNIAAIKVGFSIKNGGIASIFLIYGTPKMQPDRKLYNAIFGTAAKQKARDIQKQIFEGYIRRELK